MVGQAAQLWGAAYSAALGGFGLAAWQIAIGSVVTILGLFLQILVVSFGFGILGLALVTAPLPLVSRQVSILVFRRLHSEIVVSAGRWSARVARSMWQPSISAWLVTIGAFFTLRLDYYFIGVYVALDDVGPYFAATQIYNNIVLLALSFMAAITPLLSQRWGAGDVDRLQLEASKAASISLVCAAAGAGVLIAIANEIFDLWVGDGNFPGELVIGLISVRIFLDTFQAAVLGAARSTEFEVFAKYALAAAALNVALCLILVPAYGIPGVVCANIVAQGLTLHSLGVWRALDRLGPIFRSRLAKSLFLAMGIGLASSVISESVFAALAARSSDLIALIGAGLAVLTVLLLSIGFLVLDRQDRRLVLGYMRN